MDRVAQDSATKELAPDSLQSSSVDALKTLQPALPHHRRGANCLDRPAYRDGKIKVAVKVFTPQHESKHILIFNVPKINLFNELQTFVRRFGVGISSHSISPTTPTEDFSEVHHLSMNSLRDAQMAKRRLDDANFYGAVLHVVYAPEMETIEETRDKMAERESRYEKGLAWVGREKKSEADEGEGFEAKSKEKKSRNKFPYRSKMKQKSPATGNRNSSATDKSDMRERDDTRLSSTKTGRNGEIIDLDNCPPTKKTRLDVAGLSTKRIISKMKPKIVFHRDKPEQS